MFVVSEKLSKLKTIARVIDIITTKRK